MGEARDQERRIAAMFDRISPRYDRLNRVLSFGTDVAWRRRAAELARLAPGERALDVGAGTGDLALALLAATPRSSAIALDLSAGMLMVYRRRASRLGLRPAAVLGSAEAIPMPAGSVDRVVTSFTLRNVRDLTGVLREFRRVLRPAGRAVILELSHPPNPIFGALYRSYFDRLAPRIAVALGGDADAYRYLPRSLRPFPRPERLAEMLREVGFARVRFERLAFGIAAIHVAEAAD